MVTWTMFMSILVHPTSGRSMGDNGDIFKVDPFTSTLEKNSSATFQLSDEALFYLYHYFQGESRAEISLLLGANLTKSAIATLESRGILVDEAVTGNIIWNEHSLSKPEIFPNEMSLCRLLSDLAKREPDRKLLLIEEATRPESEPLILTAIDAHTAVSRIAGALVGSDVIPGDIVVLDANPTLETTLCILSLIHI